MRASWSTVECSWLGRPPAGRPAIDHTQGRKDRFPRFHQKQSPVYCCRLLTVHEQVTASAPPLIWKSYPANYPTDSIITLFILCLSLSLEGFLLLHLNISPLVCWRWSWVNGGPGVWDLTKVKVKQEISPVIVPSFHVRDGLMSSITPAGGCFW